MLEFLKVWPSSRLSDEAMAAINARDAARREAKAPLPKVRLRINDDWFTTDDVIEAAAAVANTPTPLTYEIQVLEKGAYRVLVGGPIGHR